MEKERGPALGRRLALLTGPYHSAELLFGFFSASWGTPWPRLHQPQSPTGTMVPLPSLDSLGPTGTMAPLPSGCLSSQSPHLRERGTYQSPLRPPSSPITTESRSFHLDMFGELAQSLAQGRPHLGPAAASAHLGVGGGGGGSPRGGPEPRQAASEAGRQGSTRLQLSAWNSLSWIPLTPKGTARFGVNCARND